MIYRAKLPLRKPPTKRKDKLNQRSTYITLPDEYYNEAIIGIFETNYICQRVNNPLFAKNSKYIFAICEYKPKDSKNLVWEGMPKLQKCRRKAQGSNKRSRIKKMFKPKRKSRNAKLPTRIREISRDNQAEETSGY
jgi:hypothetical protein